MTHMYLYRSASVLRIALGMFIFRMYELWARSWMRRVRSAVSLRVVLLGAVGVGHSLAAK
jgi:hypothetical protein